MNKLIRNASLLSLLGVIALGLGGCSSPITLEEAKAEYDSKTPATAISEVKKMSVSSETSSTDSSGTNTTKYTGDYDITDGSYYLYSKTETTTSSGTTTDETLIYQKASTDNAYRAVKTSTESSTDEDYSIALAKVTISTAFTVYSAIAATDYSTLLFVADDDDTTREFYKEGDGLKVVQTDTDDDGDKTVEEYYFNGQGLIYKLVGNHNDSDGSSYSTTVNLSFNSNFSKKTSL